MQGGGPNQPPFEFVPLPLRRRDLGGTTVAASRVVILSSCIPQVALISSKGGKGKNLTAYPDWAPSLVGPLLHIKSLHT